MARTTILIGQLRVCADCARSSTDEYTYLNTAARPMLKEAADEIDRLEDEVALLQNIINRSRNVIHTTARDVIGRFETAERILYEMPDD